MRYVYLTILGLAARVAQAQLPPSGLAASPDSSRLADVPTERRVSSSTDSTGACTEWLQWGLPAGLVRAYYPSGHLKEYAAFADLARGQRWGVSTSWYDNGQLCAWQAYQEGRRHGPLLLYYVSGALKRRTEYVDGNELPGNCYDAAGQPIAYFPYEQLPLYPGGHTQLAKEINKAVRLPHYLRQLALPGGQRYRVEVALQVAEDGSIQRPTVAVSSQVPELDQAVLNAIARLSRRFRPGLRDGLVVRSVYHVPVEFTVPSPYGRPGPRL